MKIKQTEATVAEADMTPMIDMTFQLIAFFMIVTNFEQTNADERVKLPADLLARPPLKKRDDEITVNMGYNRVNGERTSADAFIFYGDEPLTIEQYRPRLERERIIMERLGQKKKVQEATIVIRADGDVKTGQIQELIKMGQEVGFVKFALKAKSDLGDDD